MVPTVNLAEADQVLGTGGVILDVREPEEWDAGHAPDATWIPMSALDQRVGELPRDRRIVTVCRSGARSERVTQALVQRGYDAVNLAGGMQAWATDGRPVVTDAGDPGVVA
ncbi:MAG: Rhodanese domain protein [Acidimicrobiales bacterium]|jgi:rhodanese-related sulfurtransferase|nr:Rhodanese domain protein [Acidimicrobiales bacterium]